MSTYRNLLHVDSPSGTRLEVGLDLLSEGTPVVYQGVCMQLTDQELRVEVPSSWGIEYVTESRARGDLESAQALVESLCQVSERFEQLVNGRRIVMTLIHDYGNGSVAICERDGTTVSWQEGFPRGTETG